MYFFKVFEQDMLTIVILQYTWLSYDYPCSNTDEDEESIPRLWKAWLTLDALKEGNIPWPDLLGPLQTNGNTSANSSNASPNQASNLLVQKNLAPEPNHHFWQEHADLYWFPGSNGQSIEPGEVLEDISSLIMDLNDWEHDDDDDDDELRGDYSCARLRHETGEIRTYLGGQAFVN